MAARTKSDRNGKTDKTAIGLFHVLSDTRTIDLAGEEGFDFIVLDNEHGLRDPSELCDGIRAGAISGTPVLVRVGECSRTEIGRTLDTGAAGVVVPGVDGAEMAEAAVSFARHAPDGVRGFGGAVPWQHRVRSFTAAPDRPAVVAIVESMRGVEAISEIAAVEGVSAVLPGPGDLAKELGEPRDSPAVRRQVERVVDAVREVGRAPLMLLCSRGDESGLRGALEMGASYVLVGPDMLYLRNGMAATLADWATLSNRAASERT